MRESWARVGWRIGSNQFFRRPRRLPIAITFDPELRLTHEARNWRIGGGDERLNMRTTMDCTWMLDGATKDRVYALSLASRLQGIDSGVSRVDSLSILERRIESIRLVTEPIRFHSNFKFNVQNALRIDSKENFIGFQRLSDDD
ncbi:hypothetical protein PIB30_010423 [Stylosanthes scabra]|uniref:Uncharacterized protein n=1 Tax=Stylosanthes scabra TaxID=79078 RepID=A0ABU6X7D8_9FABA|nr:hypothetical protein [Stylosanthes scabra]